MKRALVLGGGGVVGVAWESGLLAGLEEVGVSPEAFDVLVGTSAGAIVGSQWLSKQPLASPASDAGAGSGAGARLIDPARIDQAVLGKIFGLWGQIELPSPTLASEIGRLARGLHRDAEASWVETTARTTGADSWPERRFLVCVVETESGERRVFERDSGVDIVRAIAASSAVPGIFPSIEIDGALYMDGQVHSSTNADVLLGSPALEVMIAMPTNEYNARDLGRHARRAVEAETKQLEAAGFRVSMQTPSESEASAMGAHLMDPRGVTPAYEAGRATGLRWGRSL